MYNDQPDVVFALLGTSIINESIHSAYLKEANKKFDFSASYTATLDCSVMQYEQGTENLYQSCCEQFDIPISAASLAALANIHAQAAAQSTKRKSAAYKEYKVRKKKQKTEPLARKFMRAGDYTYTSIDIYESDDDGFDENIDRDDEWDLATVPCYLTEPCRESWWWSKP